MIATSPLYNSEAPVFNLEILQVDADDTKVDLEDDQWIAEDDVHGGSLPAHLLLAARKKGDKLPPEPQGVFIRH